MYRQHLPFITYICATRIILIPLKKPIKVINFKLLLHSLCNNYKSATQISKVLHLLRLFHEAYEHFRFLCW
jgi:hypothetical protein